MTKPAPGLEMGASERRLRPSGESEELVAAAHRQGSRPSRLCSLRAGRFGGPYDASQVKETRAAAHEGRVGMPALQTLRPGQGLHEEQRHALHRRAGPDDRSWELPPAHDAGHNHNLSRGSRVASRDCTPAGLTKAGTGTTAAPRARVLSEYDFLRGYTCDTRMPG